nr:hypothetical protein [Bacteroides bouchesdurhonensis]
METFESFFINLRLLFRIFDVVQKNPNDLDARGIIMMRSPLFTSSRMGIGKEGTYAYDIYELEPQSCRQTAWNRQNNTVQ